MSTLFSISRDAGYIGQTVEAVLMAVGKPYDDHLFVDFEPGHLSGAAFHFDQEGWLYCYVDAFMHQSPYHPERKWSLDSFKQEHVSRLDWEED